MSVTHHRQNPLECIGPVAWNISRAATDILFSSLFSDKNLSYFGKVRFVEDRKHFVILSNVEIYMAQITVRSELTFEK
jgi:hypothetical protein